MFPTGFCEIMGGGPNIFILLYIIISSSSMTVIAKYYKTNAL